MKGKFTIKLLAGFLSALLGCSTLVKAHAQILDHPVRPESERALDGVRKPVEVLRFYGVRAGDRVADLMASRGYYTVLLALTVGDKGVVYSASAATRKELKDRLSDPVLANVRPVEGPMNQVPLPADGSLDFVLINLNYHDLDIETRLAMNRRVLAALKPGGTYGIVDHAAKDGSGNEVANTLHRIDKALVIKEATSTGFVLAGEGNMLRNPEDDRTTNTLKEGRGKSDRFVLRFQKPK
jgi:predicted methyltransferase